jgi:glutamate-5-semialdehyde dehydrogenase
MTAKVVTLNNEVHKQMQTIGKNARASYTLMAEATSAQKEKALLEAAKQLRKNSKKIIEANEKDIEYGEHKKLDAAMLDRLRLDEKRIESMAVGLETVAALPDPVNILQDEWSRPNGLVLRRVSIPLGVIGIIYESRPNVTADAAALSLKAGNATILRCGSECLHSSLAIIECLHAGLKSAKLPQDAVQIVPTRDRAAVGEMLTMTDFIDIIVPRGGKSLTKRVMEESRIPTLQHLDGNCHTYVHEKASVQMAKEVLLNAKMRRVGVCGATESLLIDQAIAASMLPVLADVLATSGCEMRGDSASRALDKRIKTATDEDWDTEYLAPIISIKIVKDVQEAITHINKHGSHHTDAIITEDKKTSDMFIHRVDSAIVMHNASTQFADGGEFGFGAEIGISTGRLHARGPVGAQQLTTYKYVVLGTGQTRS